MKLQRLLFYYTTGNNQAKIKLKKKKEILNIKWLENGKNEKSEI